MANNSIALLAKAPEFDTPAQTEAKNLQLEALRGAADIRRQAAADDVAVRGVYRDNADPQARIKALYGVSPKAAIAAEKSGADLDRDRAETLKTQSATKASDLVTERQKIKTVGEVLGYVMNNPSIQTATRAVASLEQHGMLTAAEAADYRAQLAQNPTPEQIKEMAAESYTAALDADKQLSKIETRDIGGSVQTTMTDPVSGKQIISGSTLKTQSPDSVVSERTQIRGQNMQREQAGARLAFDKSKEPAVDGIEGAFSPGAIDAAAARYNLDGTLPPMGLGKSGALGRSRILNRAAEISGGDDLSPEDQRIAQIGNKANAAALSKLQQQQTMVGAFERNFVKNADIVEEYSKKVDRTGVPILNKWINAGKRNVGGDPELAAFDVAVKAVSNEYAKIISGSMGNTATAQGEIQKVAALLNAAQTPAQVTEVVNLMRRETQNRMHGFEEEKDVLRKSMSVRKPKAAAGGTPNTNAQGWTLHTDAKGNKAYVSPDGKQFQEVK